MNNKIKELMEKSDMFVADDNCVVSGNNTEIIDWHIEKFSESIIEECISVVQNRDMGSGDSSDIEIRYCIFDLKNHFGIE